MKGRRRHAHAAWAPSKLEEGQTSCRSCVTTLAGRPSGGTSPDKAHCRRAPMAPVQLHNLCMQAGSQLASLGHTAACDQPCRYDSISNYPSPPQPASSPHISSYPRVFSLPLCLLSNYAPDVATMYVLQCFLLIPWDFCQLCAPLPSNWSCSEPRSIRNQRFWAGDRKKGSFFFWQSCFQSRLISDQEKVLEIWTRDQNNYWRLAPLYSNHICCQITHIQRFMVG